MQKVKSIKTLFQGLLWPAIAGNVVWSFFTVLFEKDIAFNSINTWSRVFSLALIATYLCLEWLHNYEAMPETIPRSFWIFDVIHLLTITLCTFSIAMRVEFLGFFAASFFLGNAIGHISGAWGFSYANPKNGRLHAAIQFCAAVLMLGLSIYDSGSLWHFPVIGFAVFVIWMFLERDDIDRKLTQ
jgi:hypothetical protein